MEIAAVDTQMSASQKWRGLRESVIVGLPLELELACSSTGVEARAPARGLTTSTLGSVALVGRLVSRRSPTADPTLGALALIGELVPRPPTADRTLAIGALALIGERVPRPPTTGDPTLTIGALALIGELVPRPPTGDPTLGSVAIIIRRVTQHTKARLTRN